MRMEDGTEHRMNRDLTAVAPAVRSPDFVDQDPLHLEQCLSDWQMMSDDWNNNKHTGQYHYPNTHLYAPYPALLAPNQFGLVVTCAKANVILSLHGASRIGAVGASRIGAMLAMELGHYASDVRRTYTQAHEQLMDFVRNDKIDHYAFCVTPGTLEKQFALSFPQVDIEIDIDEYPSIFSYFKVPGTFPYDHLLAFTKEHSQGPDGANFCLVTAYLKMDPFTVEDFAHTSTSMQQMKARVIDLGFALSAEENEAWDNRIAEMQED
jgi:hypothetical protein